MGVTMATTAVRVPSGMPGSLTVLYDERCALCRRARDWLLTQPCRLPVELLPAGSAEARRRFGSVPWLGSELVVADDRGGVWIGPAAFLTCLWATVRYRPWAYRLSGPHLAPLAERFFLLVSKRRDRWSSWLGRRDPECSWCEGGDVDVARGGDER
jgi:predicted DCC family thiol-disulfide oxidoreductase YuxK